MVLRRLGGFGLGAAAVAGFIGLLGAASADTTPPAQLASNVAPAAPSVPAMVTPDDHKHMLMQYCTACHNDKLKTAGMSVVPLDANNLPANQDTWEKILKRLSLGEMPPKGMPRPPKEQITAFTSWLAKSLDDQAAAHPDPGHATVRRMNPRRGACSRIQGLCEAIKIERRIRPNWLSSLSQPRSTSKAKLRSPGKPTYAPTCKFATRTHGSANRKNPRALRRIA